MPQTRKKSRHERILDHERKIHSASILSTSIVSIIKSLTKWIAIAFLGWCALQAVIALAGKTTDANIVLDILAHFGINKWLAYAVAGGGVIYGALERKLRRRQAKALGRRIEELEKQIDPDRTSSRLASGGSTNPDDEE